MPWMIKKPLVDVGVWPPWVDEMDYLDGVLLESRPPITGGAEGEENCFLMRDRFDDAVDWWLKFDWLVPVNIVIDETHLGEL